MTRAEALGCRFLLLIAPQSIVSGVAILVFASAFKLPTGAVPLHVITVFAAQCVFFLGWGLLVRSERLVQSRLVGWAYATALFAKALALNLLYVGSYGTNAAWGDNLSLSSVRVILPHLEGFRLAYGNWVVVVSVLLILAIVGVYAVLLWRSQSLLAGLRRAFPSSGPWWPQVAFTACVGALTLVSWQYEFSLAPIVRADPIFSFCNNNSQLNAAVFAEIAEQRNYPIQTVFHRKNVIIVTVDCLRADHLALYGYDRETAPFLSGLGKAGRLQRVPIGLSVGNESQQGTFAVLGSHQARRQYNRNFKLYDVLKRQGYRTTFIAAGDLSSYGNMQSFYGENLDVFSDGLTQRSSTVNDDRGVIEKLGEIPAAGAQPAFLYIHLMSVHTLGVRDSQFTKWTAAQEVTASGRLSTTKASRSVARYDNSVLQADSFLAQIFATLERKGYLRDFVGAITGDHGEGLGERNQWGHGQFLFTKDVGVPIFFTGSDVPTDVPARVASQIDIAPTLLARLGLPIPASWEGFAYGTAPLKRDIFLQGKRSPFWRAVVRVDGPLVYKYLFTGDRIGQASEMLFDLTNDPQEQNDLIGNAPAGLLEDLRRAAARNFEVPIARPPS